MARQVQQALTSLALRNTEPCGRDSINSRGIHLSKGQNGREKERYQLTVPFERPSMKKREEEHFNTKNEALCIMDRLSMQAVAVPCSQVLTFHCAACSPAMSEIADTTMLCQYVANTTAFT